MCEDTENKPSSAEQQKASEEVINEVIEYLIGLNKAQYPELETLLEGFNKLREKELLIRQDIALFFSNLFIKNKDKLVNSCKP